MKTMLMKILLPLAFMAGCCCSSPPPCIQPPPTSDVRQYQIGVDVAAKLAAVPIGGSLGVNFSNTVNTQFDKLADSDKSLYLFLSAIQCYLKEGAVGQDIAKSMAAMVEQKWSSKEPGASPPASAPPTARHLSMIQVVQGRSPDLAPKIKQMLATIGAISQ